MTRQISSVTRLGLPFATSMLGALQPLVLVLGFQLGSTLLVDGHNPINFCNGLLFGNLFSLITLLSIRLTLNRKSGPGSNWAWRDGLRVLMPVAFGALLEAGILIALSRVEAIQVALVLTMTSIVLMVLEALEKRRWPSGLATIGLVLVVIASCFIGAIETADQADAATAVMGLSLMPNTDWANKCLLIGLLGLNVLYYKKSSPLAQELGELSFGIWQASLQSLIFLAWATSTFGLAHLYDLRSPFLWQVMLLYGAVLSTAYTLLESAALAKAGPLMVSLFEGLLPFLSALFAWVLLKQSFTVPLVIGTIVVCLGIACIELANARTYPVRS
jgi:drug/metabolite transporter (DMT)-like permease